MNIREHSQGGLIWFRPAWRGTEYLRALQAAGKPPYAEGRDDSPVYIDDLDKSPHFVLFPGRIRPSIRLVAGQTYRVDKAVLEAKTKKRPNDSPEGRFARLAFGNDKQAVTFLNEFGPLCWQHGMLAVADWVHLDDFWARQARFQAISRLWRSLRDGDDSIAQAWEWIRIHYKETKIVGENDLGRKTANVLGKVVVAVAVPMPWEASPLSLGLLSAFAASEGRVHDEMIHGDSDAPDPATRRTLAIALIQHELTQQTRNAETAWRIEHEGNVLRCVPIRSTTSLWSEMWGIFAAEAAGGLSWRFCRECGKPFYPSRIDSDCCNTTEQSAYSKRQYATRNRKGR